MLKETRTDIMHRLQKEILPLQGIRAALNDTVLDDALGPIKHAFQTASFPLGAIHEFIATGSEDAAATGGFVGGLLSCLMRNNGVAIWVSACRTIFPPALKLLGIAPDKMIFIDLKKENQILWAMEEALKCNGLSAVIGEMQDLSFTASRRLQLAVEQSQVTGFVVRRNPRKLEANACVTRWKITSLPSEAADALPGVGFPRWKVELLKVRNGKPAIWEVEWAAGHFEHVAISKAIVVELQKKVG